jgi:hypothetical protein
MAGEQPAVEPEDLPEAIAAPPIAQLPEAARSDDEIIRGKIISVTPPQEGGPQMYVFAIDNGKETLRVTAGPGFDRDLITLDACRQVKRVLVRGSQITAFEHVDGREVSMEEAAATARPLHAQKKRSVVEHSPDAPAFMRFKPSAPEAGDGGPSLG